MNLNVFVHGRRVATLSSANGFEHHLTYLPDAPADAFVALQMPVRAQSWSWPALHPFFQVSLPEGFLLSVLKEQLGPHLGASPLDLLAVVGHNMVGRVQVSAGEQPATMVAALELKELLHGESSEDVFLDLLSEYAVSGVSGVVPKFLTPETRAIFRKGSIATERHIVKGSSAKQPFIALNEHLCMEAARRTGFDAARTQVSDDGRVLVVERFDIDPLTLQRFGFEDCCSLLGLDPDKKYDSTWERVARLTREWVPPTLLVHSQEQMAVTLLLTMALGNADCHSKNVAFMYSGLDDIRVAPVYDMLTTLAYDQYADNPPGMYIDGRKSWNPDKALWRFLQQHLGVEPPRQRELVDLVCQSVSSVVSELIQRTRHIEGFADVGRAMLWQWNAGMKRLTNRRTVVVPDFVDAAVAAGLACPVAPLKFAPKRIGESELLAPRGKRRVRPAS